MPLVRYITHPEVVVDPSIPVTEWGLSRRAWDRWEAMLTRPWVDSIGRVVSSTERKALQAAAVLAAHLGLTVETRAATGEIDRSATGFVAPDEHERLADECFAHPDRSAAGWERALDAQSRIAAALDDLFSVEATSDVAVVGHGGVGTLWWCHLAGEPVDRRWDQPGQGHYITVDRASRQPLQHWRPIEV